MKQIFILFNILVTACWTLQAQELDRWGRCLTIYEDTSGFDRSHDITICVVSIDKKGYHSWKDNIYLSNRTEKPVEFQILYCIARAKTLSSKNKLGPTRSPIYTVYITVPPKTNKMKVLGDNNFSQFEDFKYWSNLRKRRGLQWGIKLIDYQCRYAR